MINISMLTNARTLSALMKLSETAVVGRANGHMRIVAEEIKTESQKLVPVDTGKLMGTAYVRRPKQNVLEIGYGTDYAVYVHEIPPPGHGGVSLGMLGLDADLGGVGGSGRTARHKAPRQWKFLEIPARRRLRGLEDEFKRVDLLGAVDWNVTGAFL